MSKIKFKEYGYLMNRIAYWLISNEKKIKTKEVYNVGGKGVKYSTIKKKVLVDVMT